MSFIPAKESKFYIWFYYQVTRFLMKIRFRKVIVLSNYTPDPATNTVYYLNHNYWWDGLIPHYLNQKYFHQNARAIMEEKQMNEYSFFSRIGAFSIDLDRIKSSIESLRYSLESLKRPNSSLFIYPEGEIKPVSDTKPVFRNGLSWLYQKTEHTDYVPIAIYIDHSVSSKPDIIISVGKAVKYNNSMSKNELTELFEQSIKDELDKIKESL